jgi:quercetin dioxygenase-like cupin family protein
MPRLDQMPHVELAVSGVFVKQIGPLAAGERVNWHRHDKGHVTAVLAGAVEVLPARTRVSAPNLIEVPAHEEHSFVPLVDGTLLYCIHPLEAGEDYPLTWERDDAAA